MVRAFADLLGIELNDDALMSLRRSNAHIIDSSLSTYSTSISTKTRVVFRDLRAAMGCVVREICPGVSRKSPVFNGFLSSFVAGVCAITAAAADLHVERLVDDAADSEDEEDSAEPAALLAAEPMLVDADGVPVVATAHGEDDAHGHGVAVDDDGGDSDDDDDGGDADNSRTDPLVLLPILAAFADWLARALDLPANVCTCGQDLARRRVADAGAADGDPARLGDWLVQQAAHLRLAATVPASAPTSAMAAAAAPAPASAPAAHPSPAVERLDSFCGALRNVAVKFDVGYCESCASVLAQQHRASHAPAGGAPTAPRAAEGAPRCCAADGEHDHHEEEEDDDVDYGTWLCKRYTSFRAAARRTLADVRQTIALLAALPADATLHQRKDAVASYVHALKSCGSVFGAHCRLFLPKGRISKRLAASKHPVFYLAIARVANLEFDRWHRRKQDALPVRFSAVSGRARRRTAAGASGLTDAVSVRPPPASHLPRAPPPHPPTH